jgi:hypothetical protein
MLKFGFVLLIRCAVTTAILFGIMFWLEANPDITFLYYNLFFWGLHLGVLTVETLTSKRK